LLLSSIAHYIFNFTFYISVSNYDFLQRCNDRDLLPHLLLFTLSPEADGEVLSSFLTIEEQLHVLHFNVFGKLKTNTPVTPNTKTTERKRTRSELTEYCVTLIPDKALSSDLQHLREERMFIALKISSKQHPCQTVSH